MYYSPKIEDLQSTLAPLLFEMIQSNLPGGVNMEVKEVRNFGLFHVCIFFFHPLRSLQVKTKNFGMFQIDYWKNCSRKLMKLIQRRRNRKLKK